MDRSSRKIVNIIAIIAFTVIAVMAGTFYADSQKSETTAATEPPAAINDAAEATASAQTAPPQPSGFSTAVPEQEDVPAINGEPSMTFGTVQNNDSNSAANADAESAADAGTAVIAQ